MAKNGRAVLVMAVLSLVAACAPAAATPTSTPRWTPMPEGELTTLNLNLGGEPPTLDPTLATDAVSQEVIVNLFLGLTGIHGDTGEVIPQLATRWEVSEDGLVWTFHLRDDVYWVHYDPQTKEAEKKRKVTAHDVEYAVRRAINRRTESGYVWVESFFDGVKALDDYSVRFTLEQPAAYSPSIAGLWGNYPLPREVIEGFGSRWTEPGNLWTCGPYMLDTWKRHNRIQLVKNPHYYDASNVTIDTVNFAAVDEGLTALHMYENGDLDSTRVPAEDLERVRADPQLSKELHVDPTLSTTCLATAAFAFNVSKPPVDNRLVRKALAAAVDRQKLVDTAHKGAKIAATTFAPPGVFGSPAEDPNFEGIPFDPGRARTWLAEAGYAGGEGLPELVLLFPTRGANELAMEFLQQQWRDHLGIEVKGWGEETTEQRLLDPPHMFAIGWNADYPDEHNFMLDFCHPTEGLNFSRWNAEDPAAVWFMEVTEAAAIELDPLKRKALYFQAEKILCEDEAIIFPLWYDSWLWSDSDAFLVKPYVERAYNPLGQGLALWRVKPH